MTLKLCQKELFYPLICATIVTVSSDHPSHELYDTGVASYKIYTGIVFLALSGEQNKTLKCYNLSGKSNLSNKWTFWKQLNCHMSELTNESCQ